MGSAQGQDIIRCQMCSNPVEHHCNLCHVDLCLSCIQKHMADKSRKHEVVEYASRKQQAAALPTCRAHKKNRCETYCKDCKIPICILCMMGSHKKHEFTDINEILQRHKQQIIADIKELENTIVPKYRNINPTTTATEFYKVLSAIKEQEDEICRAVREAGLQLTDEVIRLKKEVTAKNKGSQTLAEKAEKQLSQIIQENKDILKANDAIAIINYQSRNEDFRNGPELPRLSCPELLPGIIKQDQITDMLGFLTIGVKKKPGGLKMMDEPAIISTIQSPYGLNQLLWGVQCVGRDKILTSGDDNTITQMDRTGSIIKTIHTNDNVWAMTINMLQEPVFSLAKRSPNDIYIYTKNKVQVLLFSKPDWCPVGLCYTVNGHLLVSMRSMDETQSCVVRYSGIKENQKIQYDSKEQPLFSTNVGFVLLLAENGNKDICVADSAGKAVVVVDSSGRLRFKYQGNFSSQSKNTEFRPFHIATDVKSQILICENINRVVHIIDYDGNFVRYIKHPCDGGLSIDTDHNLVIGDEKTGKIHTIKYLK
ncbi:uncharacterized protein LOC133174482 [Saccostrea echinata]|uniref:uncharacterized protein LOC133174482 n=1 Tax=Saccostrea echinata TaxID=191078 RepID=UPI002A8206A2|nr:uncharacterized protein LOC133174482 [Saccostrea echinata]